MVRKLVANSNDGLVFGTFKRGDSTDDKVFLALNFYAFSVSNRSRSLASHEIGKFDENCTYL